MKRYENRSATQAFWRLTGLLAGALASVVIWASQAIGDGVPLIIADSQRATWAAIGKVNIHGYRSLGACTGTLIAPDRVLTAAHCVVNPDTLRPYPLYRVQFVAGWHKGEHFGTSRAKAIRLHPDYDMTTEGNQFANPKNTGRDLAVIELQDALSDVAPAGISAEAWRGGSVALLGYRRDRPHVLSDYSGCTAQAPLGGILLLSCTVVEGTSGAPILRKSGTEWQVIGVVSARREAPRGPRTLGAAISADLLTRIVPPRG